MIRSGSLWGRLTIFDEYTHIPNRPNLITGGGQLTSPDMVSRAMLRKVFQAPLSFLTLPPRPILSPSHTHPTTNIPRRYACQLTPQRRARALNALRIQNSLKSRIHTSSQCPQKQPRIIHYRYNPEAVERARPLLTTEQLGRAARSPNTKWIFAISVGGATVFYFSNLEEVPVSKRKRFNCYSDASVEKEGQRLYQQIMAENRGSILPEWDSRSRMVQRVMNRLIPVSEMEGVDWEVHVINSSEMNAFVIPGGKVFVYSGILDITKNDDGLAAILGHEIAHNLAKHAAENMSSMIPLFPIRWSLIALDVALYGFPISQIIGSFLLDLGITKPASRKQESEADYIGLLMMAKACYDPKEAVKVWDRMEFANRHQDIPEWLSTHPSNAHRAGTIEKWVPKAEEARNSSGCSSTLAYSEEFKKSVSGLGGWNGFGILK
jgi:Zn-dependent protease with chaperone function